MTKSPPLWRWACVFSGRLTLPRQQLPHRVDQVRGAERLLKKAPRHPTLRRVVGRDVEHWRRGRKAGHFQRERMATHARHDQVGDYKGDHLLTRPQQIECFLTITRRYDLIPRLGKRPLHIPTSDCLVVHNHNCQSHALRPNPFIQLDVPLRHRRLGELFGYPLPPRLAHHPAAGGVAA
jgi:hypothetical protein